MGVRNMPQVQMLESCSATVSMLCASGSVRMADFVFKVREDE